MQRTSRPMRFPTDQSGSASQVRGGSSARPTGSGNSGGYPKPMRDLIDRLSQLPGIGHRSAERLAFHLLKEESSVALGLAESMTAVKQSLKHCQCCYHLCDENLCEICQDANRERSQVLIVEQPKDLIALELTGMYRGLYHVLMGRLSPLDGVGPADLTIHQLFDRIEQDREITEVVLGLNPTVEGDGTALYLAHELKKFPQISVSRLARGIPSGGSLEFANKAVLADAILGRQRID